MKKLLLLVSFCFVLLVPQTQAANCGTYKDVDASAWYCETLEKLQDQKALSKEKDYFYPSQKMNRAEALKFIYEITGVDVLKASNTNFFEINGTPWFKDYFYTAYASKYIQSEEGKMNASELITKSEFMVLFLKISGAKSNGTCSLGSDAPKTNWVSSSDFLAYTCLGKNLEISTKGFAADSVDRAVAMQMIYNAVYK